MIVFTYLFRGGYDMDVQFKKDECLFLRRVQWLHSSCEEPHKKWEDTDDTLPMESLQEFENIQWSNYNQIACIGEWFC